MSQLPPGFVLDNAPAAPVQGGPVYGAPPKPEKPEQPKTTWRPLTPEEAAGQGLPTDKPYQISSEGKIDALPTSDTKATVDQQKIATLLTRIAGGFSDIRTAVASDPTAQEPGVIETVRGGLEPGGLLGIPTRALAGAGRRTVYDSQVDVLDALLTLGTGAAYNREQLVGQTASYFPQYGDTEQERAVKNQRMMRLIEAAKANAGPAWTKVEPAVAPYMQGLGQMQQRDPNAAPPVIGNDTPPQMEAATGDTRRVENPELTARLDQMVRKGAPLTSINAFLTAQGASPIAESDYAKVRDFLAQNPGYEGSIAKAWKLEPIGAFERAVTQLGNNPVGAYFVNAGQFLTGNTLDNLTADPARARAAFDVISAQNPNAAAVGQVSGGIMGALGGEAMLARGGMAAGLGRSVAADAGMGAANAAGAADRPDQSRLGNAMLGAVAGAAGSLAGNAAVRGISRAVGPTGGAIRGLYEAGVNATPGQRFANAGPVGRMVNTIEQKLQSIPGTGDMIAGARQGARDDFQIGAFNEALKEVGEQLPSGMKPGTAPQEYAQKTFDRVYAEARKGMRMVQDEEFASDIANLAGELSTLGPAASKKFKAVIDNNVTKRMANGELSGEMYKRTVSDLGKWAARFRKGGTAEDQMLADAVESLSTSFENAARRHSDPEAVALLDAADAGYAKLVRIEDAARRAGGDPGTFTPNQFDRAVQNTSGGTRSKAYLRGDALMQDYATQGKNLSDTVPNSGTADRLAVARLGLAALTTPIAVAYAPGVRKAVSAAMAPAGPGRQAIAQQLKKRAALVGRASAASAAASLPGTSPAQ